MTPAWRRIKPGWYLLVLLLVYALIVTIALGRARGALREARSAPGTVAEAGAEDRPVAEAPARGATPAAAPSAAPAGLWVPVPGATLPAEPAHLPGADRSYRRGVSQGFDFYGGAVGVPIEIGTPVVAATDGTVVRADRDYAEPDPGAWEALLADVAEDGASEEQLDRLRGRQVWLRGEDGRVFRYAHLSGIRDGIEEGRRVYRGQVVGYVGNSGTDDGVRGGSGGARLHFEIWDGDEFFGQGMTPDEVRIAAASLFTGP